MRGNISMGALMAAVLLLGGCASQTTGKGEAVGLQRVNPASIAPPVGNSYSHVVVIPPGSTLFAIAGQVGLRPDRSLPESAAEQATQAFANLEAVLASQGLTSADVVKLNILLAPGVDLREVAPIWTAFYKGNVPAMTLAFVEQLYSPRVKFEVEAWAAKPPTR